MDIYELSLSVLKFLFSLSLFIQMKRNIFFLLGMTVCFLAVCQEEFSDNHRVQYTQLFLLILDHVTLIGKILFLYAIQIKPIF